MPGFPFTTVEPNQFGQVTKWDVPLNDWVGMKFQNAHDDTLGEAISRATEDFIWDDHNPMSVKGLNASFGIEGEGGLHFDKPMSAQRAALMHDRKRKELETESYLQSASHSWHSVKAGIGFGASLVGGLSHPVDLGLSFLPFVGSEKAATEVAGLGGAAWRQALQRGVVSEEALLGAKIPGGRLTVATIDGVLNQAVMEIPIAWQKHRDQANYTIADSAFNILAGGAFAGAVKGLGLALEKAARLWREAEPRMREGLMTDTLVSVATDKTPTAHWAFGMDEAAIAAKVEERVRAENPLDETGLAGRAPSRAALQKATSDELITALNRGEVVGILSESDASIVNKLIDRVKAGERGPELMDSIAAYLGRTYDPQASLKSLRTELHQVIEAITRTEELSKSTDAAVRERVDANLRKFEERRNVLADDIARTQNDISVREQAIAAEREQSVNNYLTAAKAEHEARIKGLVDAETQKVIDEVKRQAPPMPKETVDRYQFKSVPDEKNVAAINEDTAEIQKTILNLATTEEDRLKLETEIKAALKELDEQPKADKAIDALLPCATERAKK